MKFKLCSFKNRCYYAGSIILTVQLFSLKLGIGLSEKEELTNGKHTCKGKGLDYEVVVFIF